MAYTQKRFPNDESEFPTPPLWLVWNSDIDYAAATYDQAAGRYDYTNMTTKDKGQVRHQPTLEKAKRNVHTRSNATGDRKANTFWGDWAIYHWEGDQYVLKYGGSQGQLVRNHPLWSTDKALAKDGTIGQAREVLDEELEEALNSIRSAIR